MPFLRLNVVVMPVWGSRIIPPFVLEYDILATFSKANYAQYWARDFSALHLELEPYTVAAPARQVELPLVLDLAIVGCEVVQSVARSFDFT